MPPIDGSPLPSPGPSAPTRRRFLGYVLAGSTLAVAAQMGLDTALPGQAKAATPLPSNPQVFDAYDLSDLVRDSCRLDERPAERSPSAKTAWRSSTCPAPRSAKASRPRWPW